MIQYRKLLISWIVASIVMFSMSYVWHGVILNDFNRMDYPQSFYLTASVIAYLIIGLIVSKVFTVKYLDRYEKKPMLRGLTGGAVTGFVIYLLAFVIGISFGSRKIEYIIVDLLWQIIEQSTGGVAVGLAHVVMHNIGWNMSER